MGVGSSRSSEDVRYGNDIVNANANANANGACRSPLRRARGQVETTMKDLGGYLPLYRAAVYGEWKDARIFLDQDPEALTARITIASDTALHIAVGTGRATGFVDNLIRLMSSEDLALTDQYGETALSVASMVGNIQAAKILVKKNPSLPNISGKNGFPIHKAAQYAQKEMVLYLLDVTKDDIEANPFGGETGGRLLIALIAAEFYDIALYLVKRYPEMATVELNAVDSPLSILARKPTAFPSGRIVSRWSWLSRLVTSREANRDLKECQALELVKEFCKEIMELDDGKVFSLFQQALHDAAKSGIPEIIQEIVEAFPPAIWFTDENNYNVFQLAVLNRRENVFNLLYQMTDYKFLITRYVDPEDNNILHLAGRLPPSDRLNLVTGPALQVQRELLWFQEVAKFVQPAQKEAKNKEGNTPIMVFIKEHKQLLKDGAKWMKQTATSSTVGATLIATVAFNGAMHVPGGNNTNGLPLLLHHKAFIIFVVADAISLFSSLFSLLVFLSIITSRYSEVDFLKILPRRLALGLSVLFFSIIAMMEAFGVALYLLFRPTDVNYQMPPALFACLLLLSVPFLPLLYRILSPIIKRWKLFGMKSYRIIH